jgi:flavin reductase (DIM6/NTAB) family NADH-FMN oxidoreductase RutF
MHIDLSTLPPLDAYKLLSNLVIPRPIAWVTSLDALGRLNAAPFSFFNLLGSAPPVVALGIGDYSPGTPKHTAANIAATRDFVINLVTEDLAPAMNLTATDFPEGFNELAAAGLHPAPSARIPVPRIAESPIALECTLHDELHIGANRILLGIVLAVCIDDSLIDAHHHIHNFTPIGRLGSPSWYTRTQNRFELPRLTYAQWKQSH